MARMHVTLPQELYDELKRHGWSASEVLQEAIRERVRLEEHHRAVDEWCQELLAELGPPTEEELAIVDRLVRATPGAEPEQ